MQYLFHDDNNLYSAAGEQDDVTLPSNIKQIGSIEGDIKIYVEDYVHTYLYQYARSGGNKEKLAALAGKRVVVEGKEVIIISGAIQAKDTKQQRGAESFTEDTWRYINGQMEVYFKGLSLLGWVHTQPGFGTFLMAKDEAFHREHFKEPWQVLFVIDSLDKLDTFFIHNAEKTGLRPAKGYFIYYEKNQEMQEYMLDNSLVRPRLEKQKENIVEEGEEKRKRPTPEERMDAAKDIRRVLKKRAKEAEEENRSRLTMLAGVSSILCIACLFMGVSLLNNISRVRKLETEIATVQNSYYAMAEQLEEAQTQMVFAAQKAEQQQQERLKKEAEERAAQQKREQEQKAAEEEAKRKAEEEQQNKILAQYVVEVGDSLGYISSKFYGTSAGIKDIMAANGINDGNKIICGQTLIIPKR